MMTVADEFEGYGLRRFVKALFDGGVETLPAGFADLDPVALVDAIVAERSALGPRARVHLNGWSTTEALVANAVLAKLDQARRLLPGSRFDDAWQAIGLSLDFATWGNEPWSACLLPNGAVLFRSFQHVLAVEEQPFAELECGPDVLRAALEALAEVMLSNSAPVDADGEQVGATALADRCSVLHRSATALTWSSMLPKRFSMTGQTLVMLPERWVVAAAAAPADHPLLGRDLLLRAAAASASGHLLIRTFQHRAFVHVLQDVGSRFDTLVEVHGERPGSTPSAQPPVITQDFRALIARVRETVRSQDNQFAFSRLSLPTRLLAQHALDVEYAASKAAQMLEFVPLLGPAPDVPATAYEDVSDFSALERFLRQRGRHLLVFVHAPGIAGSVDDYLSNALTAIERFLRHAELDPVQAMLRIDGLQAADFVDDEDLSELGNVLSSVQPGATAEASDDDVESRTPTEPVATDEETSAPSSGGAVSPWADLGDLAVWQSHGFVPLASRRGLRALRRLQRALERELAMTGDEAPLAAAEAEEELLSDLGRQLCLAVALPDEPVPSLWTEKSEELARAFPSLAQVLIPCYGYVSGFSRGVLDSGNHLIFEADRSAASQ